MMQIESSEHLFEIFEARRKALQLSQRKANKEAGLSPSTWSLIEARDDKNMTIKTALAYAKALKLELVVKDT